MMMAVWLGLILLTAAFVEVFLAAGNILAPLYLPSVFYLVMVFGWRRTVLPAVFAGLMIDAVLGRPFWAATFGVGLTVGLARAWQPGITWTGYPAQALPSFILGFGYGFLVVLGEWSLGVSAATLIRQAPATVLRSGLAMAVGGAVLYKILDMIAVRADLPGLLSNRPEEVA